jgi:hypothetical protein
MIAWFNMLATNGWQICDVVDLVALTFILAPIFIRNRMFLLPQNPPYPQMCCYGMVYKI